MWLEAVLDTVSLVMNLGAPWLKTTIQAPHITTLLQSLWRPSRVAQDSITNDSSLGHSLDVPCLSVNKNDAAVHQDLTQCNRRNQSELEERFSVIYSFLTC